jgi:xylose isomerase
VLWGTAQLFKDRRYMHGAATSCNASVFAHAAAQVKSAIDATVLLGGQNYVLWGGREGYSTMLNTDYKHEQQALAAFLRMVADYAKKAGLKGHLLLEPKPHEPSKHQCESAALRTASRFFGDRPDDDERRAKNHDGTDSPPQTPQNSKTPNDEQTTTTSAPL